MHTDDAAADDVQGHAGSPAPVPPDPIGGEVELHWLSQRKRIVAREVQSAAITPIDPADLNAVLETNPPARRGAGLIAPEIVHDPTVLGERHRKRSHQRIYRLTQITVALTFLGTAAGLVGTVRHHPAAARLAAIATVLLGVAALRLAARTPLSARLRGYAIAATLLAALALAANLLLFAPRPPAGPAATRAS